MHWDPLNSEDVPLNEYLEKNIGEFITIKFPKTEHVGKLIRISPDYKFVTIKWDSRTGTQEFPVEQVVYEPTSRMRSRVKTSFLINDEKIFINKPKKERLARKPKKEKRVAISYKVEGEDQCDDDHDDEDEGESEDSHDEDFVDLMSDDKEPINKRRYRTKASRNGNGPIGGKKNIADDSSKEKRRRIKTSIHVNERPVLVERQKEKMNERIHKKRKVDHEYPSKLIMEDSRTQSTSEVKSLRVERPQDHKHGERKEEEYEIPSPRDRLTNDDDSTITNELNNQSLADFSEHVIDLDSSDWTIQRVGHDPNEKFITDDLNNIFTVLDTEKVMFDHESRVDGKRNDTHVNQGAKKSRVIFAALEKPNVDVKGCSEKGHLQSLPHSKKECPIDEVKHHRQDRIDVNTNASTFQVRLDEIQAVNRLDEYATVREPLIDDSEAGINEHVGDIETKPLPEGHTYSDMLSTRFHTPSDNRTQRSDAAPASYRTPTFTPDIMVTQHVADLFCFISDLVTLAKMPYNNNASDNDDRSDGSKLRLIKPLIAAKLKLPLNIYRESTISSEFFEQKLKPIISGKEFPFTSLTSIPRHHLFEKESSANSFSEYNIPSSESIEDILFASLCFRSLDSLSTFEAFGGIPHKDDWLTFRGFITSNECFNSLTNRKAINDEQISYPAYESLMSSLVANNYALLVNTVKEIQTASAIGDLQGCYDLLRRFLPSLTPCVAWEVICDLLELRVLGQCSDDEIPYVHPLAEAAIETIFIHSSGKCTKDLIILLQKYQNQVFEKCNINYEGKYVSLTNMERALRFYGMYLNETMKIDIVKR